jgi:HPr Serine kinase C-terminal domain
LKQSGERVYSYRICGLSVASDISLPGVFAGRPDSFPQVTIRRGPVPEVLLEPKIVAPTWQMAGNQILLQVPNVARFLLKDGEQIVFAAESESSAADVPIFILGTVLGILLHQRKQIVLHASAVEVNGKAVAFCGASGAGKSTLAAVLIQRGYRLITDDVCAITLSDHGPPIVNSDGHQLKLWAEAIEELNLEDIRREPVRGRLEKFYVEPRGAASEALPLGAVYVLQAAGASDSHGIERPNLVDAAVFLRQHAYRPQLVTRMEQNEHYFRAAAAITSKAGIYLLTRRLQFETMPQVVSWLEQHWHDLGVTERAA